MPVFKRISGNCIFLKQTDKQQQQNNQNFKIVWLLIVLFSFGQYPNYKNDSLLPAIKINFTIYQAFNQVHFETIATYLCYPKKISNASVMHIT